MKKLIGAAMALALCGCSGAPARRAAVETWAAAHLKEYTKCVGDNPREISNIAGLQCLLDEDAGKPDSAACACARPGTDEERRTACAEWQLAIGGVK